MQVTFFFRKPKAHFYSIERVFNRIIDHLPPEVNTQKYVLRYGDKGLFSRLRALWEVHRNRGNINHITGDITYVALVLPKKGLVVTFHDLESFERSASWRSRLLKYFWVIIPARRAQVVTVISEHTRQKVLEWTSIPESKIVVIPNPLPDGFEYSPKGFNGECPKVLCVGTKPNKNFESVLQAVIGIRCTIIVLGSLSDRQIELINQLKEKSRQEEMFYPEVDNRNGLSDPQLIDVYKECDLLCFPSFYEGFGMPIIEAQSIGRPVVTSCYGAMKEVAGEGALFVDPSLPVNIRDGIQLILQDEDLRNQFIEKGLKNAGKYLAHEVVSGYTQLYMQIIQP